jgi:hypothetical protein
LKILSQFWILALILCLDNNLELLLDEAADFLAPSSLLVFFGLGLACTVEVLCTCNLHMKKENITDPVWLDHFGADIWHQQQYLPGWERGLVLGLHKCIEASHTCTQ